MQIWAIRAKVIIKFHTEFYQPVKLAQICVMTTRPVQSLPSLLSQLLSSICAIFWWGFSIWTQLKSWQGGGSIRRRRNQTAEPGTHEALLGMEASWDHVSSDWLHGCALFIQPKRMFPFTTVSYICSLCMGRSRSFKMRHLICLNMSGQASQLWPPREAKELKTHGQHCSSGQHIQPLPHISTCSNWGAVVPGSALVVVTAGSCYQAHTHRCWVYIRNHTLQLADPLGSL